MRTMGLDVGSKTAGVAISDPLVLRLKTEIIPTHAKGEFGLERLGELVKEYKVDKFVIGLPVIMNNFQRAFEWRLVAYGQRGGSCLVRR